MAIDKVREYLKQWGKDQDIIEYEVSSATVELAAEAAGVIPGRIAKTLSFSDKKDGCILVVAAGDAKVNNSKFKQAFGVKASMLAPEEALVFTGHTVGGICPFAVEHLGTSVYCDISLKRFDTVLPACGSSHSCIVLTLDELVEMSASKGWVDVCKGWAGQDENDVQSP